MSMFYTAVAVTVFTAGNIYMQDKAAKAQKEAANKQQAMQEIEASRNRKAAVREARLRRAELQSSAQAGGVAYSSGAMGAQSSLNSQLGGGISFQNTQTQFSREISSDLQKAADYSQKADTFGSLANLSMSIGSFSQSYQNAQPPKKPQG
jgi:hypothetical protein